MRSRLRDTRRYDQLRDDVAADARRVAGEEYRVLATPYGVPAAIPLHAHTGTDSPRLPPTSVEGFQALTGTAGGVLDPATLAGETVNADVPMPDAPRYCFPLNVIVGTGGDAFNGGAAPEGAQVVFVNGATAQLWVMARGAWRGVNLPLT